MPIPTILEEILQSTRADVARRQTVHPLPELIREAERVRATPGRFEAALRGPGVGVIAEFKRRSPSAGVIREGALVQEIVGAYLAGGACALSVLTEGPHFGGSLEDLRATRAAVTATRSADDVTVTRSADDVTVTRSADDVTVTRSADDRGEEAPADADSAPGASEAAILRKDFVVDSYQLYEALGAGADAILLIVAALTPTTLAALHREALDLGLDVLVEVHNREELAIALDIGARVIGVNNRDLHDFSVDPSLTARLMEAMPSGVTVVSESGISDPRQLVELGEIGLQAVLVGESLMREADPRLALMRLRGL